MKESLDVIFCELLRLAFELSNDFPHTLKDSEWEAIFRMAKQQTTLGVIYKALLLLPQEKQPSRNIIIRWAGIAETIRGQNHLMNLEAVRYTHLFNKKGIRCVILKGQANARLYPDPLSRQSGDIDIWVPGDYESVVHLLLDMGLISENSYVNNKIHHIEFRNENNIVIEIHHKASSDILFRNKMFQKLLLKELRKTILTPEGFYVPNIRFALLMQLSHLQHHFLYGGLGIRQYIDYFMLLKHSTESDRKYVWNYIKKLHLKNTCSAVMGVLERAFKLPKNQMLCPPSTKRSLLLYKKTFDGGNFGKYAKKEKSPLKRWLKARLEALQWFTFDPLNIFLKEIQYWKQTIFLIPTRIRLRKIHLQRKDYEKKIIETLK